MTGWAIIHRFDSNQYGDETTCRIYSSRSTMEDDYDRLLREWYKDYGATDYATASHEAMLAAMNRCGERFDVEEVQTD